MKVIDNQTKKLTAFNRNYFFIVTVLVTATCITLHACLGSSWSIRIRPYELDQLGFEVLKGSTLLYTFLNSFAHANWQHCLLNMLCFFICGCWLERKEGSLKFLILLLLIIFITSRAITAVWGEVWVGYSGVNYGLYAYTIVDFLFSLRKSKRDKFNLIGGYVMMALIYFAMCFNGGTSSVSFEWYPFDLIYNGGHHVSFIVILPVALLIQAFYYLKSKNRLVSGG